MKFSVFTVLASLIAVATAQGILIGSPADGSSITAGQKLTVQVVRPDTLTGSDEVALVISILQCSGPCNDPATRLGTTLYQGGYDPEFPTFPTPRNQPQQNFTVTVPSTLTGTAQLAVTHFALVGASPEPLLQIRNVTLKVQD